MEVERQEVGQQSSVINTVECFGKIGSADDSSERRLRLVKALSDLRSEGDKGGYTGSLGGKAVLEGGGRKVREEEGAD